MGLLTRRLMDDLSEAGFQRSLAALLTAVRNHRRRQRRREAYSLRPSGKLSAHGLLCGGVS